MSKHVSIRPAVLGDAPAISQIIKSALKVSNSKDYPAYVIDRLLTNFEPSHVETFLQNRLVYVAERDNAVVGTASLDFDVVRTVFIAPEMQRQGIGRALMGAVLEAAFETSVEQLTVPSSITAVAFYEKLGFARVREEIHEGEKTIFMQQALYGRSGLSA